MNGKSVLIVENIGLIAMDIMNICIQLGYSSRSVCYNSETIKEIEAAKPDLILMDIELDGRRNIIVEAERICDEFNVPILFFTTDTVDSSESDRLKNRCLFHRIPFDEEELVRDIKKLLQDQRTAYT